MHQQQRFSMRPTIPILGYPVPPSTPRRSLATHRPMQSPRCVRTAEQNGLSTLATSSLTWRANCSGRPYTARFSDTALPQARLPLRYLMRTSSSVKSTVPSGLATERSAASLPSHPPPPSLQGARLVPTPPPFARRFALAEEAAAANRSVPTLPAISALDLSTAIKSGQQRLKEVADIAASNKAAAYLTARNKASERLFNRKGNL